LPYELKTDRQKKNKERNEEQNEEKKSGRKCKYIFDNGLQTGREWGLVVQSRCAVSKLHIRNVGKGDGVEGEAGELRKNMSGQIQDSKGLIRKRKNLK
jgi:hypothetical protein